MLIRDNQFIIEKKPKGVGCIYAALSFIGLIMVTGTGLFLYAIADEINFMTASIPTFVILLGSIFFLSGISYKMMQFNSTVIIDKEKEHVTFYQDEAKKNYFGLGQVAYIRIAKVMKIKSSSSSSAQNTTYPTYQVFLVKKDGAHFWLDTFLNRNSTSEFIESLYQYCGLPIKDDCGFGLERKRNIDYVNEQSNPLHPPSQFIHMKETEKGKMIKIKNKKSFLIILLSSAAFLLFFAAPLLVFFSWGSPGIFFSIFAGIFGLFWYTSLFFIGFTMMKRSTIYLNYDELVLDIGFKLRFMDKFFGNIISIRRDRIKYIRVHRLDEGHFWISVSTDTTLEAPEPNFFLKMGFITKDSFSKFFPNEKVFGLWEVSSNIRPGKGADYSDLLFLENLIEKQFFLKEEPVD